MGGAPMAWSLRTRPHRFGWKHGVSDATFYKWRSRYGGMEISDPRKLKGLEEENRKLKKLLAESMLDVSTLKETYYVAMPFIPSDDGIEPGEALECFTPNAAVKNAEALSRKPGHVGAVAFSRTGDPSSGDFGDAKVIRKFGDVPDDLTALHPLSYSGSPQANASPAQRHRRDRPTASSSR
jgi:hypothetical protein